MILAVDVYYRGNQSACAAGILFPRWESDEITCSYIKKCKAPAPYEPGAFYKRELPCILSLLHSINQVFDIIIVDGYVNLGNNARPGLGMHLYQSLEQHTPIIGIAKNTFVGTPEECKVYRGKSRNPLFVTSVGITLEEAKLLVQNMHGKHRIPTVLKKVDQMCRELN